jgi:hypothetical protein
MAGIMGEINRSAVILNPKAPFLEWMASISEFSVSHLEHSRESQEPCVYLVKENEDSCDIVMQREWAFLFERELAGWDTRESSWPQDRNLRMFRKWFDIQVHLLVFNVVDETILDRD